MQFRLWVSFVLLTVPLLSFAQTQAPELEGVDSRVDYNALYRQSQQTGIPWDDRNLSLDRDDLALLPEKDLEDTAKIPLAYRVEFRRAFPDWPHTSGKGQYPLSAAEVYEVFWGGTEGKGLYPNLEKGGMPVTVNGESEITTGRDSAESAIAINPIDPNIVIAGVNGPGGQEMYYSSDGGLSWTRSTSNLGSSCCDPTVAWSPDGTIAYMAQLGGCFLFGCNIEFFTSTDNGVNWGNKISIATGSSHDKEFIHVDTHPSSPHFGNLYIHWHSGNVIQFARSLDNGQTFQPRIQFPGTRGIGGDIATDSQGKIYVAWSEFGSNRIDWHSSTDGGETFSNIETISSVNATFNFEIPTFDRRLAPVIVSVSCDTTGGSFNDRVYATWADLSGPDTGNATNNHAMIRFAYSDDGGQNWQFTSPHPTNDINSVDRFNPWMDIDDNGGVHVVYLSTQNDPNRLETDLYHVLSTDGGETFGTPLRVSAESSGYISDNFQWGDYNGLSIVGEEVRPIWTDRRATSTPRAYTADMSVTLGPTFAISGDLLEQTICVTNSIDQVSLDLTASGGFSDPVDLDFESLPAGFSGNISPTSVTPPGTAMVDLSADPPATEGHHPIVIEATSGAVTRQITLDIFVRTQGVGDIGAIWQDEAMYNENYDFNGDGEIGVDDLIALMGCLPTL